MIPDEYLYLSMFFYENDAKTYSGFYLPGFNFFLLREDQKKEMFHLASDSQPYNFLGLNDAANYYKLTKLNSNTIKSGFSEDFLCLKPYNNKDMLEWLQKVFEKIIGG